MTQKNKIIPGPNVVKPVKGIILPRNVAEKYIKEKKAKHWSQIKDGPVKKTLTEAEYHADKKWREQEAKTQKLTVENIKAIFERITDEDTNILGFSDIWCRPEWLICSVLPVPPPTVRPSVKQGNSQRMDDDLTHKLADIIRYNESLKMKINKGVKPEIIQDWTNMLQYRAQARTSPLRRTWT